MRGRYIREQWTECGEKYAEVDLFWVTDKEHRASIRQKKQLASTLAQQKRNAQHSRRYFIQLINCNFDERGFHVSLTYDDAFLPVDGEEAARNLKNWLRRLRGWLRRNGYDANALRWIAVTENQEEDKAAGLKAVRYHHHVLVQLDGIDRESRTKLRDAMEDLWQTGRGDAREPLGRANADRLQPDEDGLAALAGYLLKYPKRKKRWSQSRGLQKPRYRRPSDTKWTRRKLELACTADAEDAYIWEQRYPGWRFLEACPSYSEELGEWRIYIRLRRKPQPKSRGQAWP